MSRITRAKVEALLADAQIDLDRERRRNAKIAEKHGPLPWCREHMTPGHRQLDASYLDVLRAEEIVEHLHSMLAIVKARDADDENPERSG